MQITDEMCQRVVDASGSGRIQSFSTPQDDQCSKWGAPYYICDVSLPLKEQEIWRGDDADECHRRFLIEQARVLITAALSDRERDAIDAARRMDGIFSECPGNPEGKVHCFNMETNRCVHCDRPMDPN